MAIPTHGPFCQVVVYDADCWGCGQPIHVLECSCGSAVLFDSLGSPWPKHQCAGRGGIGGSGLSGWAAIDTLRANGVPINAEIMKLAFPGSDGQTSRGATVPESIKAVPPTAGQTISLIAVVRELLTSTKRTTLLKSLGEVGAKLLRLPKGDLWQLTLIVNRERPNLAYTCILPSAVGLPKSCKDKMVFAQLEGRGANSNAIWLVTEAKVI